MKRAWIALAILLTVLAGTLCHSFYIERFTGNLIQLLEQAESRAEAGEWDLAERLSQTAHEKWDKKDGYLHVLLRHSDTDQIYMGFYEVEEFLQRQEDGEYSAANAKLIAQLELLSEAEQLSLKNLF